MDTVYECPSAEQIAQPSQQSANFLYSLYRLALEPKAAVVCLELEALLIQDVVVSSFARSSTKMDVLLTYFMTLLIIVEQFLEVLHESFMMW